MDTTETFIKMRRKAIPYLGLGRPVDNPCSGMGHNIKVDSRGNWYYGKGYELFQLERQDQLQERINMHIPFLIKEDFLATSFDTIMRQLNNSEATWEQLWLAFVMRERWNKTWDGENWQVQES